MTDRIPSALEQTLARHRSAILARDTAARRDVLRAYELVRADLLVRIDALAGSLEAQLAAGETLSPGAVFRLERWRDLDQQARREITRLSVVGDAAIRREQAVAVTLGQRSALDLAAVSGGSGQAATTIVANWSRLPAGALSDLVGTLADGSPLRELLLQLGPDTADAMSRTLIEGLARGAGPREIAASLTTQADITATRALTISRTEVLRSYRTSQLRTYAENDDILTGWVWSASLSERTCGACLALDGREFPLSMEFFPSHPNCRCAAVPSVRGTDAPPQETGNEWLARQDETTQDRALGSRAAGEAYRRGEVPLSAFVRLERNATWGDSYQRASLRKAMASQGRRAA